MSKACAGAASSKAASVAARRGRNMRRSIEGFGGMCVCHRDARGVRVLLLLTPLSEGGGAERRKSLWCPYPLPDTAGASRRANKRSRCEAVAHKRTRHACAKRMRFAASYRRRTPLQSRTVCPGSNCQLLAGTPNGPGGSSDAARVLHCDEARRRRTPSRNHDASRERPFSGRGGDMIRQVRRAGIRWAQIIPPRAGRAVAPRSSRKRSRLARRVGWRAHAAEWSRIENSSHPTRLVARPAPSHPPLKGRDLMEVAGLGDDAFLARMAARMPSWVAPVVAALGRLAVRMFDVIGIGEGHAQGLAVLAEKVQPIAAILQAFGHHVNDVLVALDAAVHDNKAVSY